MSRPPCLQSSTGHSNKPPLFLRDVPQATSPDRPRPAPGSGELIGEGGGSARHGAVPPAWRSIGPRRGPRFGLAGGTARARGGWRSRGPELRILSSRLPRNSGSPPPGCASDPSTDGEEAAQVVQAAPRCPAGTAPLLTRGERSGYFSHMKSVPTTSGQRTRSSPPTLEFVSPDDRRLAADRREGFPTTRPTR